MPPVGADSQRGPQGHADALDRALNPLHRAVRDHDVAHMGAFAHLHTHLTGAIEEQGVESVAREPDRRTPRLGGSEIGEESTPTRCVDEHRLHAVRSQSLEVISEPELTEQPRPGRIDVLRAGFVTWEACLVEEEDAVTAFGQKPRRDTAGGAASDDDDVRIALRHVRPRVGGAPPPYETGDAL
jgi:hypothetical protein